MATEASNEIRVELANGNINFSSDTIKIALMADSFTFDKDSHGKYADVSASELASGNGYLIGGNTLTGVYVAQNNTDDNCTITWNSTTWTASGGDIGPSVGAIVYDDTHADKTIIGYIDFSASYTEAEGGVATISNITVII